ncbi:unnamed protein product, partial [marine sediment metagenome]
YLNDSPTSKWGDRRWNYAHGFDIVAVDEFAETITISGDFVTAFPASSTFVVADSTNNDGTYTVVGTPVYSIISDRTEITVTGAGSPHVQGTADGIIEKRYGMWENIRLGIVPTGRPLPTGRISTGAIADVFGYSYFSVNITNDVITGYGPDDVFPPYWDQVGYFGFIPTGFNVSVRSLYGSFTTQIISPSADYAFGDAGPIE